MTNKKDEVIWLITQIRFVITVSFRYRICTAILLALIMCLSACLAATCPSSISSSTAITIEQFTVSEYTPSELGLVVDSVSNSIYVLNWIHSYTNHIAIVRKLNASGSQNWITAFGDYFSKGRLSVDTAEKYVYLATYSSSLLVTRYSASSGAIMDHHRYRDMYVSNTKICPLPDNSGYLTNLASYPSSDYPVICKYTFTLSNAECQYITNIRIGISFLILSNTQLLLLGYENSSFSNFHMYKLKISSTSVEWANKIVCSSSNCNSGLSESLLSKDGSNIYQFFNYCQHLYFTTLSVSTGSVMSNRYRSSFSDYTVHSISQTGEYVVATSDSNNYLLIYSIFSASFIIKYHSKSLYECGVELSTGRLIIAKQSEENNGYISKFYIQTVNDHPDFSTSSESMDILSAGTDDIVSENDATISATIINYDFSNEDLGITDLSSKYSFNSFYTSDIRYQLNETSISIIESTSAIFSIDLTCSYSGATPITYKASNFGTSSIPSWISLDSSTGMLNVSSPNVEEQTEYNFFIDSVYSAGSSPLRKRIKLIVVNCKASNCQKCSDSSESNCQVCNSGFVLFEGSCVISNSYYQASQESKKLGTYVATQTGGIFIVTAVVNIFNSASILSFWIIIGQMQMLFLLLTRWIISDSARAIIRSSDYAMNIYDYIPISKNKLFDSMFSESKLILSTPYLKDIGISSNSSLYNTYPILIFLSYIMLLHFCLHFSISTILGLNDNGKCGFLIKIIKWAVVKLYDTLTFGFYIRNFYLISQFIMISIFYEFSTFHSGSIYCVFSLIYAVLILLFYFAFVGFLIFMIFSHYKETEGEHNKLSEFFRGIKELKKSRIFPVLSVIRKALFNFFLLGLKTISSRVVVAILSVFQFLYVAYYVISRPYKEVMLNILEINNEIFFFFLISILNFLYKESHWNSVITGLYIALIVCNFIFILFAVLIHGLVIIIKYLRAKKKRSDAHAENSPSNNQEEVNPEVPVNYQEQDSNLRLQKSITLDSDMQNEVNETVKSPQNLPEIQVIKTKNQIV